MNEITEMLKGLTDIPIALLALVFGIILLKKRIKNWSRLFFLIAVSAVMGTVVHVFTLTPVLYGILWIILYILLFESIRVFTHLMIGYVSGTYEKEKLPVFISEAVLYITAVILLLVPEMYDIYALVVFMMLMMARLIACIVQRKKVPKSIAVLVVLLIVPIALQACAGMIPYAVAAEHMFLLAALSVVFEIAVKKREKDT